MSQLHKKQHSPRVYESQQIIRLLKKNKKTLYLGEEGKIAAVVQSYKDYQKKEERYKMIEGVLLALQEAEAGRLHDHSEALKILDQF